MRLTQVLSRFRTKQEHLETEQVSRGREWSRPMRRCLFLVRRKAAGEAERRRGNKEFYRRKRSCPGSPAHHLSRMVRCPGGNPSLLTPRKWITACPAAGLSRNALPEAYSIDPQDGPAATFLGICSPVAGVSLSARSHSSFPCVEPKAANTQLGHDLPRSVPISMGTVIKRAGAAKRVNQLGPSYEFRVLKPCLIPEQEGGIKPSVVRGAGVGVFALIGDFPLNGVCCHLRHDVTRFTTRLERGGTPLSYACLFQIRGHAFGVTTHNGGQQSTKLRTCSGCR